MVDLSLFVYVYCCPNNMIYISTCAQFQGDQEYVNYKSYNFAI